MDRLAWIDNRTLILCHAILIATFSFVMVGLRSIYPKLRGIGAAAFGFLLGVPALLLLAHTGPNAAWEMEEIGGPCMLLSSILLYHGLLQFCAPYNRDGKGHTDRYGRRSKAQIVRQNTLYAASGIALLIGFGCAAGRVSFTGAATALCLTQVLSRGLMAWTLYRGSGSRYPLRYFAFSMALFASIPAVYIVQGLIHPISMTILQESPRETIRFLLGLVFFCIQGVFYLLMYTGGISESVYEEARRDFLSGALNRRGIEDALSSEVARTRRLGGSFAAMLIDIDHFKTINDRFGHTGGDAAIRNIAECITETVRVYDAVGRYGGDEFLLLMPQITADEAMLTAERIRLGVKRCLSLSPGASITVSIGVTLCSRPEEPSEIVARADEALYEAKAAGRDCKRLLLTTAKVGTELRTLSLQVR
jgi:diguanylate cyclase (GGDEF)-like protein